MSYDFWDYFWGWVILAAFFVPVLGAILIQVIVFIVAMVGGTVGLGTTAREPSARVKINSHDMDEDY
jgi:hypothetical protein